MAFHVPLLLGCSPSCLPGPHSPMGPRAWQTPLPHLGSLLLSTPAMLNMLYRSPTSGPLHMSFSYPRVLFYLFTWLIRNSPFRFFLNCFFLRDALPPTPAWDGLFRHKVTQYPAQNQKSVQSPKTISVCSPFYTLCLAHRSWSVNGSYHHQSSHISFDSRPLRTCVWECAKEPMCRAENTGISG